jgi:hypothetical protein
MMTRKRLFSVLAAVSIGAVWLAYGSDRRDDFFGCNQQAVDATRAELAGKSILTNPSLR